jgi:hypothetical protein
MLMVVHNPEVVATRDPPSAALICNPRLLPCGPLALVGREEASRSRIVGLASDDGQWCLIVNEDDVSWWRDDEPPKEEASDNSKPRNSNILQPTFTSVGAGSILNNPQRSARLRICEARSKRRSETPNPTRTS